MNVTRINDWRLEDRLAGDPRPIVVMFVKSGEANPREAREELRWLASVYPDARFYEVDLCENPSAAKKYGLPRMRPVTLVFVGGVEQARHVGQWLTGAVERVLGPHPEPANGEGD